MSNTLSFYVTALFRRYESGQNMITADPRVSMNEGDTIICV